MQLKQDLAELHLFTLNIVPEHQVRIIISRKVRNTEIDFIDLSQFYFQSIILTMFLEN